MIFIQKNTNNSSIFTILNQEKIIDSLLKNNYLKVNILY